MKLDRRRHLRDPAVPEIGFDQSSQREMGVLQDRAGGLRPTGAVVAPFDLLAIRLRPWCRRRSLNIVDAEKALGPADRPALVAGTGQVRNQVEGIAGLPGREMRPDACLGPDQMHSQGIAKSTVFPGGFSPLRAFTVAGG